MRRVRDSCTLCTALLLLLASSAHQVWSQSQCSRTFTYSGQTKVFDSCSPLSVAPGVSVAWTYKPPVLEVGFTGTAAAATNSWVAWGINPANDLSSFMSGATVCMAQIDASGAVTVQPRYLNGAGLAASVSNPVPVNVSDRQVEFDGTTSTVKIYASVTWSSDTAVFGWNNGLLRNGNPVQHSFAQLTSKGSFNLTESGTASGGGGGGEIPNQQLKYRHGILAVVSWGILIPLGIMVARYARPFEACDPAWFYTHILFQVSGFVLGSIAWGMGIKLGNDSVGVHYGSHRSIGIVVFTFSILQVLALVLRPNKDNKTVRPYWNVYHHSVGFSAALLAIVNIFLGFHILKEQSRDKSGYRNGFIAVLAVLAGIAFVLEVFTWMVHFKRKSKIPSQKMGGHHDLPSSGYA